jgi:cell volume regulation protein A
MLAALPLLRGIAVLAEAAPGLAAGDGGSTASVGLEAVPVQGRLLFLGVLFLGTLAVSRFSIRIGIPSILGVLLLGLFININSLHLSHHQAEDLHVFGLALLLFYAGLKTELAAIRGFLEYGLLLAIGGVIASSTVLGLMIWWLASDSGAQLAPGLASSMPLAAALLIAACLGSTDAGATLSVLTQVRHRIPQRLRHLLEFESAVNDPAALLTYGLIVGVFVAGSTASAATAAGPGLELTVLDGLRAFLQQIGVGMIVGVTFGYVAKFVIDWLVHEKAQLLVVAMSIAFVDYGCSHFLGGAGFVAVYVTGMFMSNMRYRRPDVNHESIQEVLLPFNTMTEITIFLLFGLLVSPSDLLPSLSMGVVTAAALMLVARPLSVLLCQPFSPFSWREGLLISWCGLRGAVPLALSYNVVLVIPRLRGVDAASVETLAQNAQSIVFVVVVLNLLLQGFTLPRLASFLGLQPEPPAELQA